MTKYNVRSPSDLLRSVDRHQYINQECRIRIWTERGVASTINQLALCIYFAGAGRVCAGTRGGAGGGRALPQSQPSELITGQTKMRSGHD